MHQSTLQQESVVCLISNCTFDFPMFLNILSRELLPFPAELVEETGRVEEEVEEEEEEGVEEGGAGAGMWGGDDGLRSGEELEPSLGMGIESAPEREREREGGGQYFMQ